jgi:Glycosyltransferase (GlcNAc)
MSALDSKQPCESDCTSTEEETASIFVSIIAYRDPETQYTIDSIFRQAAHSDRIHIGVVWQYDPDQDSKALFAHQYPRATQVRHLFLPHTQAKGPIYARALAEKLYSQEDFVLQIDSHMRLVPQWDVKLVRMWYRARANKDACVFGNPIITTYPPGYERSSSNLPSERRPTLLCAKEFSTKDGILRIVAKQLKRQHATPILSRFYAAGFAFSAGSVFDDVPYDIHLKNLFFGEESTMAVRLWTHGYDFFAPSETVIFHLWSRSYRPSFREVTTSRHDGTLQDISNYRMALILNTTPMKQADHIVQEGKLEMDKYGCGTKRSLCEYQEFAGVNYSSKAIRTDAELGGMSLDDLDVPKPAADMAVLLSLMSAQSLLSSDDLAQIMGHNKQ